MAKIDPIEVGEEIRTIRHDIQWAGKFGSKEELAKKYDISVATLKSVEMGYERPDSEAFVSVARMIFQASRDYAVELTPGFVKYLKWARRQEIDI